MNRFSQIPVFLIVNTLGFFSGSACYIIGLYTGVIRTSSPDFDAMSLKFLLTGVFFTWLICAVFSIASFFTKGMARAFFLLAPIVFPLGYGLRLLFLPL